MAEARDKQQWEHTARITYFIAAGAGLKKHGGAEFTERELNPHNPPPGKIQLSPTEGVELLGKLSGKT